MEDSKHENHRKMMRNTYFSSLPFHLRSSLRGRGKQTGAEQA